ncbi:MAG: sigma-70 family RNA polymerase sigma factor [Bacteroidales bacterium]|jgi:RNA polymerase sigma factor (sigma-70 family)|nr:sigma-70 family RNA polymerase sigma factor [Bacteroidales bacterium]
MQKIDWNEVYRKQSGALLGVAYRYIKERKQAEDLVQDALIAAIQKAERFAGKGAFEAWLRKIVVNECLMYLRKSKLKTETLDETSLVGAKHVLPSFAEDEDDFDYADDPDKRKIIERCNFSREDLLEIATHLPEHHRLVFNMYVIDEFSHKDIAAQLNISEGTSKSHLNRARKKLQDLLYEKALDMQKKKKKRLLVAVWLTAMFGKVSVVDAMHRKAFMDFKLLAPPPSVGLEQAIFSAPATASIGLSTTATAFIAGSIAVGGVGGTVGVVEYQKHRADRENTSIEYQMPEVDIQDETIFELDFFSDTEPVEMPDVGAKHASPLQMQHVDSVATSEPVIIKKTTIIIDTIHEED